MIEKGKPSAMTSLFTAPIAIAAGGFAVVLFALGQSASNSTVRELNGNLKPMEDADAGDLDPAKAR